MRLFLKHATDADGSPTPDEVIVVEEQSVNVAALICEEAALDSDL